MQYCEVTFTGLFLHRRRWQVSTGELGLELRFYLRFLFSKSCCLGSWDLGEVFKRPEQDGPRWSLPDSSSFNGSLVHVQEEFAFGPRRSLALDVGDFPLIFRGISLHVFNTISVYIDEICRMASWTMTGAPPYCIWCRTSSSVSCMKRVTSAPSN